MEVVHEQSVALLNDRLDGVLDRLQVALAKAGGADAPSQQFGDPAAGRALALMAAGAQPPDVVRMETEALNDHLMRLFGLFGSSPGANGPGVGGPTRMTALGFRKLVRAAQLTCERCTDVDVDLIYQQVVKTRGAVMRAPADMLVGLSMVAKRLYPEERSQSAAFHRLLTESLLPWLLQVRAQRAAAAAARARRRAHGSHRRSCARVARSQLQHALASQAQ
jgi:hypothetical protein